MADRQVADVPVAGPSAAPDGPAQLQVLVTRPEPGASRTVERLRARGASALAAPLFSIVPTMAARPKGDFAALLVTSANGAAGLSPAQAGLPKDAPVLAVGAATAAALRQNGFSQVTAADGGRFDLAHLAAASLPKGARLLVAQGEEAKPGLDTALEAAGFAPVCWIRYRAPAVAALPEPARAALAAGEISHVLHYSRRAAETFARLAQGLLGARPTHLCLSEDVAEGLRQAMGNVAPEPTVLIAERPDETRLLALLDEGGGRHDAADRKGVTKEALRAPEAAGEGAGAPAARRIEKRIGTSFDMAEPDDKRDATSADKTEPGRTGADTPRLGKVRLAKPRPAAARADASPSGGVPALPAAAPAAGEATGAPSGGAPPSIPSDVPPGVEAAIPDPSQPPPVAAQASEPVPAGPPIQDVSADRPGSAPAAEEAKPSEAAQNGGAAPHAAAPAPTTRSGFGAPALVVTGVLAALAALLAQPFVQPVLTRAGLAPAPEAPRPQADPAQAQALTAAREEAQRARQQVDALERRVAELAARPASAAAPSAPDPAIAQLREATTRAQAAADAAAQISAQASAQAASQAEAALAPRLAEIEQAARSAAAPSPASNAAVQMVMAERLGRVIAEGRPFPAELAALRAVGASPEALQRLTPASASGAPTAAAITAAFRQARPAMMAETSGADLSFTDRLLRLTDGLVRVRVTGAVEGASPSALAARIEQALQRADAPAALAAWSALPEPSRRASQGFGDQLRARAEADEAAKAIMDTAVKALAGTR